MSRAKQINLRQANICGKVSVCLHYPPNSITQHFPWVRNFAEAPFDQQDKSIAMYSSLFFSYEALAEMLVFPPRRIGFGSKLHSKS